MSWGNGGVSYACPPCWPGKMVRPERVSKHPPGLTAVPSPLTGRNPAAMQLSFPCLVSAALHAMVGA